MPARAVPLLPLRSPHDAWLARGTTPWSYPPSARSWPVAFALSICAARTVPRTVRVPLLRQIVSLVSVGPVVDRMVMSPAIFVANGEPHDEGPHSAFAVE